MEYIKQQLDVANMGLDYDQPMKFLKPGVGRCSLLYVVYRISMAAYVCSMCMYSYLESGAYAKWFIYLTHWSFGVLTAGSVLSAGLAIQGYLQRLRQDADHIDKFIEEEKEMPNYCKAMWVLQNISFNSAIIVTTMYWGAVYDPSIGFSLLNTSTHISNTMYVLLDFSVVCMPVKLLHVWHSVVYFLSYGAFSYIYYFCGGTNETGQTYVYTILDYQSHPMRAFLIILGTATTVCLVHVVYFAMGYMRDSLIASRFGSFNMATKSSPSCEKLTSLYV